MRHPIHTVRIAVLAGFFGAGIALLLAPESGAKLRRRIRRKAGELAVDLHEQMGDATHELYERGEQGTRRALKWLGKRVAA